MSDEEQFPLDDSPPQPCGKKHYWIIMTWLRLPDYVGHRTREGAKYRAWCAIRICWRCGSKSDRAATMYESHEQEQHYQGASDE